MLKKIILLLSVISICFFWGCNDDNVNSPECDDTGTSDTSTIVVRKPNIYLYPTKTTNLEVFLSFPKGGTITESIPEYNTGWNCTVNIDGTINNQYKYLYYECNIPDEFQREKGWLVEGSITDEFFNNNLKAYGFNENERKDFLEYWIPLLEKNYDYYVYPQLNNEIDKLIELNLTEQPANLFRLYYVIEKAEKGVNIPVQPEIIKIKRKGFTVVEWGGALK